MVGIFNDHFIVHFLLRSFENLSIFSEAVTNVDRILFICISFMPTLFCQKSAAKAKSVNIC